jgi:aspartate ammonia-lyase
MDSRAVATALVPTPGYARMSKLGRQSEAQGRTLLKIFEVSGLLTRDETLAEIDKASHPVFKP